MIAYGIAAPYVFPWYLAWGLPALALCYRSRTTIAWLILAVLLSFSLIPDPYAPGASLTYHPAGFSRSWQLDYIHWGLPVLRWVAVAAVVIWALHPGSLTAAAQAMWNARGRLPRRAAASEVSREGVPGS